MYQGQNAINSQSLQTGGAAGYADVANRLPEIPGQLNNLEGAVQEVENNAARLLNRLREAGVIRTLPPETKAAGQVRAAMQTAMGERLQRTTEQLEQMAHSLRTATDLLEV